MDFRTKGDSFVIACLESAMNIMIDNKNKKEKELSILTESIDNDTDLVRLCEEADILIESAHDEFLKKHGIKETKCGVGFSESEGKWYGWSHRAIYGFKIGDKCKKGQCGVGGNWTFMDGDVLKTLDDCKQRAIDFSESVS